MGGRFAWLGSLLIASGCGLILETREPEGAADTGGQDGGDVDAADDAALDAGLDGNLMDATFDGPDVDAGCTPTGPEICFDGLDQDCNGDDCGCDRYVLADADGPGSGLDPTDPMLRVVEAIGSLDPAGGGGRVCVAAHVTDSDACQPTVYAEDVVMVEGVSVYGGFHPDDAGWYRDAACETILQPSVPSGVLFPPTVTRATVLGSFTVIGASVDLMSGSAAVTFVGGGEVSQCKIAGGDSAVSFGVRATGMPLPGVEAAVVGSDVSGGAGSRVGQSIGIAANGRSILVAGNLSVRGAQASFGSHGIILGSAPGSEITGNAEILADVAEISTAVHIDGNATGVSVSGNTFVRGGIGGNLSAGIAVLGCSTLADHVTITGNETIAGGGAFGVTAGVTVEGCRAVISANGSIFGHDTGSARDSAAVRCAAGGTACDVDANRLLRGSTLDASAGQAFGILIVEGANGQLTANPDVAGSDAVATESTGISLSSASGRALVDRNHLVRESGRLGTSIRVYASDATVSNNHIEVQPGGRGILLDVSRPDGLPTEATVHSNTVIAAGPAAATAETRLLVLQRSGLIARDGVIRNNIFACDPVGRGGVAVDEGPGAAPRLFQNNDLVFCDVLYRTSLLVYLRVDSAAVGLINARLLGFGGNMSRDPLFVAPPGDCHVRAASPVIDQGSPESPLPPVDYDGDVRPLGSGPDIGYDEAG